MYATNSAARTEVGERKDANWGLLRVHVAGSYVRLKLCKFLFNCVTPIEFLPL